uniref:Transcription factor IIIC 90kDa subunit N-terminal domain-containing protein n=1 Tax=Moniliophthora roreri TaxID=221103 RepID=A0A0W0F4A6_MONRR
MIQFDPKAPSAIKWPEYSPVNKVVGLEWSAVSLGSIDPSIWTICFSPSGLGFDNGCVMALLTSNMDLSIWMATRNALKGEWIKVVDVTPILLSIYAPDPSRATTTQTLCAQIISITWSSPADFALQPTPNIDTSLLVAGTRAGSLLFFRFDAKKATVNILGTVKVSSQWITHVAFSTWILVEPGICEGTVAYATSAGRIGLVNVRQTIQQGEAEAPRTLFGLNFHIQTTFEHMKGLVIATNAAGITALKWIHPPDRSPVLVYNTPGLVRLWSAPASSTEHWGGSRQFLLKAPRIHATSSSVHPVTGLQYIAARDSLLLCLLDGSYHVLRSFSTSPELQIDGEFSTLQITRSAREVFERVELMTLRKQEKERENEGSKEKEKEREKEIGFRDVNRMCAMGLHDESGVVAWIHEASRPTDFSYKHDAKHNSMFVVARLWDDLTDDAFLIHAVEALLACRTARGLAPLNILRSILFHMRSGPLLERIHTQLLAILSIKEMDTAVLDVVFPEWDGQMSPEFRADMRGSLLRHLSGWDALLSMRMRLLLADYAWKMTGDPKKRSEYGHVAQTLLTTISHRNLRSILKHLGAISSAFTLEDVPFVLRMVVQSVLQGSPADLAKEGERLSGIVHAMFPPEQQASTWDHLDERCPACNKAIPLTNIITAECPNKHIWSRCSITTFILTTPDVRTCIGCTRKAFLPGSSRNNAAKSSLPEGLRGWFVEELLEAVQRCLFCGNAFVTVL